MLVDVHAHMDHKDFEKDIDEVIKRSEKENFGAIISNGTDPKSNRRVLELSKKHELIKATLGIYPIEALELSNKEIDEEIEFIRNSRPIAIGEVGLDNYRVKNLEKQKEVLTKIAKLSRELDIPLIVHSRKAEEETINLLEKLKIKKVIMHCFSGNGELTERGIKIGWMFSIPAMVITSKTYRKLAKRVPTNQILTETDAPFLSPIKGERNESSNIKAAVKKISELKKITSEELEKIIYANFQRMFI